MKRKYREAAQAKLALKRKPPKDDDDAPEVLDWFEKWARTPEQNDTNESSTPGRPAVGNPI